MHHLTWNLSTKRFVVTGGDLRGRDAAGAVLAGVPGGIRQVVGVTQGTVTFPSHPAVASKLFAAVASLGGQIDSSAHSAANDLWRRTAAKASCLEGKSRPAFPVPIELLRAPMVHQSQAVLAIRELEYRALLADEMGLGKSLTALAAVELGRRERGFLNLGVVCPASVKHNWRHEIETTTRDSVLVIDGDRQDRLEQFASLTEGATVVINYDLLAYLTEKQFAQLCDHVRAGALILDESHYLKDHRSRRSSLCAELAKRATCVLLLTGTPVRNTIADLYHQVQLITPVWRSFYEFRDRYLVLGEMRLGARTVQKIVGVKNEAELQQIVNAVQVRRAKADLLNLPEKLYCPVELELTEAEREFYRTLRDRWLYDFRDLPKDALVFSPQVRSGLERLLRLEQVAQGFLGGVQDEIRHLLEHRTDHWRSVPGRTEMWFPASAKFQWTIEAIENLSKEGKRIVLWSQFNAPLSVLAQELSLRGLASVTLHGGLTSAEKREVVQRFQGGEGHVFLGQVRMAEGFNLTSATEVVFYGRNWSPAVNQQAEDRCHRIGQRGTVTIYQPYVRGTLEQHLHEVLARKADEAAQVLRNLTVEQLREWIEGAA